MKGLLAAACLLAAPSAFAANPIRTPAPEFPAGRLWLNAKPLTLSRLAGRRAVVVAFLNTASANSLRALEPLKSWHRRFQLEGAMVIGVHTPDFGFQRDPAVVRAALKRYGVEFPVVLDNDRALWRAYKAEGWPHFFLLDHKGRVVFETLGEGRYEEFETELRHAIEDVPGYDAPTSTETVKDPPSEGCGAVTPEISLRPGRPPIIDMDKEEGRANLIVSSRDGEVSIGGRWLVEPEGLRLNQGNADRSAAVRLIYRGAQAFALLSPGRSKTRVFVRQNGLWLHEGIAGRDIRIDEDGRSFAVLDQTRLYHLVSNPDDSVQELYLHPSSIEAVVYGFSFCDRCRMLP